jgi:8-oxo-dGTP pyrophosphatase MutT (NUDIX family)
VEPGETLLAAAKREALEETGLHTIVRRFLAAVTYRTTHTLALGHADPIFHTFAFLLDEIGGTLGTLDKKERFDEFRELTLEELSALVAELERVDGLPAEAIGAASLAFAASKGIDPCVGQDWLRFRIPAHRVVAEALRRTETG